MPFLPLVVVPLASKVGYLALGIALGIGIRKLRSRR